MCLFDNFLKNKIFKFKVESGSYKTACLHKNVENHVENVEKQPEKRSKKPDLLRNIHFIQKIIS